MIAQCSKLFLPVAPKYEASFVLFKAHFFLSELCGEDGHIGSKDYSKNYNERRDLPGKQWQLKCFMTNAKMYCSRGRFLFGNGIGLLF